MITEFDDRELEFIIQEKNRKLVFTLQGQNINADCVPIANGWFSVLLKGRSFIIKLQENDDGLNVTAGHRKQHIRIKDETQLLLEKYGFESHKSDHAGQIHVPIPGLLTCVFVKPGDRVEKGEKLAILEAMKMENEISSPSSGIVKQCYISVGTAVEKGDLIMELDI